MKSIRNEGATDRLRVLAMGCSWSYRWPGLLPFYDVAWEDRGGGLGLYQMHGRLDQFDLKEVDWVVVQLPTPIRSADAGRIPLVNTAGTLGCFSWFVKRFQGIGEQAARTQLIDRYIKEIESINEMHPRVLFFVFNVGGYPFRSPFDFGPGCDDEVVTTLRHCDKRAVQCSLEGQSGYAMREHDGDRGDGPHIQYRDGHTIEMDRRWNVIDPPGRWIEDPHPNRAADRLAAATVEEYICENTD